MATRKLRITRGDLEPSLEVAPEPTRSTKPIELSNAGEEKRVLPIPIGEGTSEVVAATSAEPVVIILQEFPTVVTRPPRLPPP